MGTVYEAEQLNTGRRIALKVLSHSLQSSEARSRFLREGRLAASINHPNSVYVFGTAEIEGVPTITMELVTGGTLASLVQKSGPMPVEAAVDAILEVISGLEAAEQKGILHRDVKPANCFLTETGQVKIGDFGLSVSTEPHSLTESHVVSQEGVFLGTPAFASPEQLRGEQLDQRSDIYAVAVTLYFILTAQPPFAGSNMVQLLATALDTPAPDIRALRPDVPDQLARIIDLCLAKSPGSRPATYAELRRLLLPFSTSPTVPASLGQRFVAGAIDQLLASVLFLVLALFRVLVQGGWNTDATVSELLGVLVSGLFILYFGFCESRWGATIGKRLLGLSVNSGRSLPKFRTATLRATIFVLVPTLPQVLAWILYHNQLTDPDQAARPENRDLLFSMLGVGNLWIVVKAALFMTARRANGYAAIHDLITGVRVMAATTESATTAITATADQDHFQPGSADRTAGPFHVLKTLGESQPDRPLLLGYDTQLLRRVWIRLLPPDTPAVTSQYKSLSRPGRLRWLAGHRGEQNWDCYECPAGCSLQDLPADSNWQSDRHILVSLAKELNRSFRDNTLPDQLSVDRLWVDGRQLKFLPMRAPSSNSDRPCDTNTEPISTGTTTREQQQACIRFISLVARWLMEDRFHAQQQPVVYQMPVHARRSLVGISECESLETAIATLQDLTTGAAYISQRRRIAFLAASLAIPAFILAGLLVNRQITKASERQFPEIGNLARDAIYLELVTSWPEHQDSSRQITALEIWIAGHYRELVEDPVRWNSMRSSIQLPHERKALIQNALSRHRPTEQQIADITPVYQSVKEHYGDLKVNSFNLVSPVLMLLLAMLYWLLLVWVPAMVTALLFGGGLLMKSFGIVLVNRRGHPVSRSRAFLRMLLPGLLCLGCIAVILLPWGGGTPTSLLAYQETWPGILVVLLLSGLLAWSILSRRFLSDRLTGCHMVPR
jgi:hypothetical protein